MEKVYKIKVYRVILNLIMGVFASGLVFYIASIWLESLISMAIGVLFFLSYIWLVILSNQITIIVSNGYLLVKKGNKTKQFKIDECSFHARATTSRGDTSCELTVTEANGNVEHIDCELIGYGQFQDLLEDLGVVGDNAPIHKLQTKKGEKE